MGKPPFQCALEIWMILYFSIGVTLGQHRRYFGLPRSGTTTILQDSRYLAADGKFGAAYALDDGSEFKEESDEHGNRRGSYSYVDPNGEKRSVTYTAGVNGFQAIGDHIPSSPALPSAAIPASSSPVHSSSAAQDYDEFYKSLTHHSRNSYSGYHDDYHQQLQQHRYHPLEHQHQDPVDNHDDDNDDDVEVHPPRLSKFNEGPSHPPRPHVVPVQAAQAAPPPGAHYLHDYRPIARPYYPGGRHTNSGYRSAYDSHPHRSLADYYGYDTSSGPSALDRYGTGAVQEAARPTRIAGPGLNREPVGTAYEYSSTGHHQGIPAQLGNRRDYQQQGGRLTFNRTPDGYSYNFSRA